MIDKYRSWLAAERPVTMERDILFGQKPELWSRLQFLAEHVASAVQSEDGSGIVFGISAPWGSGKTSALRVILDLMYEALAEDFPELDRDARGRGFLVDGQYILTTSTFRANLHSTSEEPARLSLAYDVLQGFPESYLDELLSSLRYPEEERGLVAPISAEMFLRTKLREYSSAGPAIERWILESFLQHRADTRDSTHGHRTDHPGHVHVQFVDDLDRCTEAFTAQVLAALNFWSAIPNLYFVVAADEDHLKRSARAATDLHENYNGEALEKFVHFQLRMPPLITGYNDAAAFALRLLPKATDTRPGVEHFRNLLESVRDDEPYGLMTPALRARTPRQAKRVFNELLQEFWILKDFEGDSVKRIIARLVWPEAFDEYVVPALLTGAGGDRSQSGMSRTDWLRLLMRAARSVLDTDSADLSANGSRLVELAGKQGVDLQGCPTELLLYLAAEPTLSSDDPTSVRPLDVSSSFKTDVSINDQLSTDLAEPTDAMSDLVTRAQIAESLGDFEQAGECFTQILDQAQAGHGERSDAGAIGNLALAVSPRSAQTAWALHQLAFNLNPSSSNIRLNLVDFLLDQNALQFVGLMSEHLAWIRENDPNFKSIRRRGLEARLLVGQGKDPGDIDDIIDEATTGSDDLARYDIVFNVLSPLERVGAMDTVMQAWVQEEYAKEDHGSSAMLIAIYAQNLIAKNNADPEARGVDATRYVLARGYLGTVSSVSWSLVSMGIFLANREYVAAAAALYRLAYELTPQDPDIRNSYARFLLQYQDDAQNARAVQQGQEVSLTRPTDDDIREVMAPLPDRYSRKPYWWEAYEPAPRIDLTFPVL